MADKSKGTPFDTDVKKKARIEIIPLIDVIFFLLATFVLFSISLNRIQSMEAKLPVTAPPDPNRIRDTSDEPLVLQVSDGSTVYINREPSDIGDIYARVLHYKETTMAGNKTPRVLITGDDRAKYGSLIRVLDLTKSAGVEQISFETIYRASGK